MAYVYRDTPVGFHRVNKMPLDDREVFDNTADLLTYIRSGAAYQGQRCLVKLPYYEQPVILKKGKGSVLMPIIETPPGYEWVTKEYNNDKYALIYYYNGGAPFGNVNQQVRLTDGLAWSFLPQAGLIAGTEENINYMLEYFDTEEHIFTFVQANFCTSEVALPSSTAINRISSKSNNNGFFTTSDDDIVIMPRRVDNDRIVRLWVKCNDYNAAIGLGV